jgi:hypothetical protein
MRAVASLISEISEQEKAMAQSRFDSDELNRQLHQVGETGSEQVQAWEEIETGRYMPRRIRGSYRGRTLG